MRPGESLFSIFSGGLLKLAAWSALAYLGYWTALALQDVLVAVTIAPLAGAPVGGWQATPWRVMLSNAEPQGPAWVTSLLYLLPLFLQTFFLAVVCWAGARLRSALARIVLHYAATWTILQIAVQVVWLDYLGRGRLARLLTSHSGSAPLSVFTKITATTIVALALVTAARVCIGRLVDDWRGPESAQRLRWTVSLLVVAPMLVIILTAFEFMGAVRYLGLRALLYLWVPASACAVLAVLGWTRKPRVPLTAAPSALRAGGSVAAICAALIVGTVLGRAENVRVWIAERPLGHSASAHYEILYDPHSFSPLIIAQFKAQHEEHLRKMAARLGAPLDHVHLRVVLYPSFAAKQAAMRSVRPYSVEGTTIRAVLGGPITEVDPAADAAALLHAVWGAPGSTKMGVWAARWLAGEWRGQGLAAAAAQIEREAGHSAVAQLLDPSSDGILSPLVREPLGAAWFDLVDERAGGGGRAIRELYRARDGASPAQVTQHIGVTLAQAEEGWRQWSAQNAAQLPADPPAERRFDANFFFRGISFSHEGWSGAGGGYASAAAEAELRRIAALGANAIAVVPYGFARGANEQAIFYTSTDETNEDLTQALWVAHRLGMKVMLKPQLWVGRGEFSGALKFDDPAVRAAWMRNYREFILHYARLAEFEQFDLLAIGTELEGVTPYEEDWRRLIADVRRIYHGPITYAANWGREFESIRFWDALDYAAVNNYYPLAEKPPASAEDLLPGAKQLATRLESFSRAWHKPILFTEIGYPSARGGASQPWIEDAGREVSVEEQAAAYEAVFRAFCGQAQGCPAWFRGMFWWKWPSNGRGGGPRDTSYTPMGKPAEQVLRTWFTRLAGSATPASGEQ